MLRDCDDYLRSHGMDGENPWEEWANSAYDEDGNLVTGWLLKNAHLPARVPKEHSESAWLTTRGIEYIEAQGMSLGCATCPILNHIGLIWHLRPIIICIAQMIYRQLIAQMPNYRQPIHC